MRTYLTVWLALVMVLLLFGCNQKPQQSAQPVTELPAPPAVQDSIEQKAMQHLYNRIITGSVNRHAAQLTDNEIKWGDTLIRLVVTTEHNVRKDGRNLYAAKFSLTYKAGKQMTFDVGSIGIDTTFELAREICMQEWFGIFAIPFTDMLNDSHTEMIPGLKIFPSLMGIRGDLPSNTWLKGDSLMHAKIVSQAKGVMQNVKENVVALDIKLVIGNNGVEGGECRVNNVVSEPLLAELKKLPWPSVKSQFMFKQFYLIGK